MSAMTNGDMIRALSDKELAAYIECPNDMGLADIECTRDDGVNCYKCIAAWLKLETANDSGDATNILNDQCVEKITIKDRTTDNVIAVITNAMITTASDDIVVVLTPSRS